MCVYTVVHCWIKNINSLIFSIIITASVHRIIKSTRLKQRLRQRGTSSIPATHAHSAKKSTGSWRRPFCFTKNTETRLVSRRTKRRRLDETSTILTAKSRVPRLTRMSPVFKPLTLEILLFDWFPPFQIHPVICNSLQRTAVEIDSPLKLYTEPV